MSKIRINTEGIADLRGRARTIERSMDEVAAQIASAGRQLDMKTAGSGDIRGRVERLQRRAARQEEKAGQYANALGMVNDRFTSSDRNIAGQAKEIGYLMDQILVAQDSAYRPGTDMSLEVIAGLAGLSGMLGFFPLGGFLLNNMSGLMGKPCPLDFLKNAMDGGGIPDFTPIKYDPLAMPGIMMGLALAEHIKNTGYARGSWTGPAIEPEVKAGSAGIEAHYGKAHAEFGFDGLDGEVNATVGKAAIEAKRDFLRSSTEKKREYKDGKWSESESEKFTIAEIKVGGEAKVAEGDLSLSTGDDMLGLEGEAKGSVGSAELGAGGEFSVGEDGVNANVTGSAMVTAVEGEASGTFNILGVEVTLKAGGYAGALGVEGKCGIEDNKFVMEGGAAALVGGKLGVEVGFNDEGFETIMNGATAVWNTAADMWDDAQEFGEKAGETIRDMGDAVEDGWKNVAKGAEEFGKNVSDFFS